MFGRRYLRSCISEGWERPTRRKIIAIVFQDSTLGNRPDGSSTGGLIGGFASERAFAGETVNINVVVWRSWKLEPIATSSNDAEVQSLAVGEDVCYRLRLLWAEFNGLAQDQSELRERTRVGTSQVKGLTITYSKGAFDSVNMTNSASLGLRRSRTAVEALALKECFDDEVNRLI